MNDLPLSEKALERLRETLRVAPSLVSNGINLAEDVVIPSLTSEQIDALLRRITSPLIKYLDEVYTGNGRFGLVSKEDARDRERLFLRHVVDSIIPWRIIYELARISRRNRLYDLGSGAGLPGIPLSIVLSNFEYDSSVTGTIDETVLVERKAKRVAFLRGVIPTTLSSVPPRNRPVLRVLEADAEALHTIESGKENDGVVVFRAYQQTSQELLRSLATTFPDHTPVCVQKGRRSLAEEERDLVDRSGYAKVDAKGHEGIPRPVVVSYPVGPGDPERCLLIWWTSSIGTSTLRR